MKKLAKTLNKVFTDKAFMEDMSKNCIGMHQIQHMMGDVLTYYISTRDTKTYTFEEMSKLLYKKQEPKNKKFKESDEDALVRNIIDEGCVTHSFNGFNLSKIKKNGLGSEKNNDPTLGAELTKLEKDLGSSEYVQLQTTDPTEIYYSSPGANSIYYAMQQSPERLFNGPLKQDQNPLPVIVGEKKEDYYLRVAIDKINKNYRLEEQQPIIDNAKKVITQLCSQRPQIALIPINSKKYTLNANLATTNNGPTETLPEYLERQADGDMGFWAAHTFFSTCLGGCHPSNCSNLVSTGIKVPAKELEFVSIPDTFEMLQIKARQKGLKPGEKFHLYTLEKIEDKALEDQPDSPTPTIEHVDAATIQNIKDENTQNQQETLTIETSNNSQKTADKDQEGLTL